MTPAEHHAQALRWLAIAEAAYDGIYDHGTLPVLAAASIANVHATLARTPADTGDRPASAEGPVGWPCRACARPEAGCSWSQNRSTGRGDCCDRCDHWPPAPPPPAGWLRPGVDQAEG